MQLQPREDPSSDAELRPRSREGADQAARKPYRPPALRAFGDLVDVTRFGGSIVVDSGFGLGQS